MIFNKNNKKGAVISQASFGTIFANSKKGAVISKMFPFGTIFANSKKGFGSVASTMIMFIAVLGVSIGMVMTFQNYVVDTQDALSVQNDITSNQLRSAISISNVVYNSTSNDLQIYVKNIGATKITTDFFDLFVDGIFYNGLNIVYASNLSLNMTLFDQQEMMVIIHNEVLSSGTHEIKVVTQYGTGDSYSFNI